VGVHGAAGLGRGDADRALSGLRCRAREIRAATKSIHVNFGLTPCDSADLAGGDAAANLAALREVFEWPRFTVRTGGLSCSAALRCHCGRAAPSRRIENRGIRVGQAGRRWSGCGNCRDLHAAALHERLLDDMAQSSAQRVLDAKQRESFAALERRAHRRAQPTVTFVGGWFRRHRRIEARSPAAGVRGDTGDAWLGRVAAMRAAVRRPFLYSPSRRDSTAHWKTCAKGRVRVLAPLGVPAMRKDFLSIVPGIGGARRGAGGVLVILRMLPRERIADS